MVQQLPFSAILDIGFTALVCLACYRNFFGGQTANAADTKSVEELRKLESVLRGLIDEAGASSNNFDRRLQQRKRELEELLGQIESRAKQAQQSATTSTDEDAWFEPPVEKTVIPPATPQKVQTQVNRANVQRYQPQARPQPLSSQIELVEAADLNEAYYAQTGISDAVTLGIAKRLLLAGKEIHVVARKLDVPLTSIRTLDRMLRTELAARSSATKKSATDKRRATDFVEGIATETIDSVDEELTFNDVPRPGSGRF